jgi:hypothetical protein
MDVPYNVVVTERMITMLPVKSINLKKRSGTSENNSSGYFELWREGNPNTKVYGVYNQIQSVDESYFVGYDTPDYHRRVKRGELIPHTPFTQQSVEGWGAEYVDYTVQESTAQRYFGTGTACELDWWRITADDLETEAPAWSNDLVQDAAARIYSQGHDTLTFIAELRDVHHMFANVAKYLVRGRPSKKLKWRDVSCEWLSGRYGWRTLIYDLQDLDKAVRVLIGNSEKRKRSSEKCYLKHKSTDVTSGNVEVNSWWFDWTIQDVVTISRVGSVIADIDYRLFDFNPLITGWEVIPFSFIVDWFITIGKALAALSFLTVQQTYAASAGYKVEIERTFDYRIGTPKSTYLSGDYTLYGYCKGKLERRKPSKVPLLPHFQLKLNAAKIFDLLAIIIQRRR